MRYLLCTIGLLATAHGAFGLTWDFDDGTRWGWTAHESPSGNDGGVMTTTVYSEVADGVWRIAPVPVAQRPALSLLSPLIGEDSALFDQVTLRLRIVHDRPTEGNLLMQWFNGESRRRTQEAKEEVLDEPLDLSGFTTGFYQLYPTEWENITIDIRALEAAAEARRADPLATIINPSDTSVVWQDTLFHVQLDLNLQRLEPDRGLGDHPAFVAVDWIELTGAEELLLGELSPPGTFRGRGPRRVVCRPAFFGARRGGRQRNIARHVGRYGRGWRCRSGGGLAVLEGRLGNRRD